MVNEALFTTMKNDGRELVSTVVRHGRHVNSTEALARICIYVRRCRACTLRQKVFLASGVTRGEGRTAPGDTLQGDDTRRKNFL